MRLFFGSVQLCPVQPIKTTIVKLNQVTTKVVLGLVIILSQQISAQSDKGFYATVQSGYNFGTGQSNFGTAFSFQTGNGIQTSANSASSEIPKINLGKGFNAQVAFGYMFTKSIGLELGVNYLLGGKEKTASSSYTGEFRSNDISANMIQIKPTVVIRAGYEKINPYAKIGLVAGFGKIEMEIEQYDGTNLFNSIIELDGGMALGFHSSLGSLYKINNRFSLFGELNLVSLTYSPEKGRITKFYANGEDVLASMSVQNTQFDFVDTLVETGVPPSSTQPSQTYKIPFSFSSFGLNVGLQYNF